MLAARIVHNIVRIARRAGRIANAPRRALLGPLDGMPIRLDVINKASASRRVRTVYSHANLVSLALRALAGRAARRRAAAEAVREQPVCATLLYLLTYRGGARALARYPASEPPHYAARPSAPRDVAGVRGTRVISAFAGDADVTRHVKRIEGSAAFPGFDFDDLRHYLVAACGVGGGFEEVTLVFANMDQRVLTSASSSGPWTSCAPRP